MLKRMLCLLAVLMLTSAAAAEAPQNHPLDDVMAELFARYKSRGGVVLAARGSEVLYQYAYGSANKDGSVPVTMDTQFRIASVSKLVTAVGVMQLAEQGKIGLDEDISTYFGTKIRNPGYRSTAITPRMILSHTSSLDPEGDYKKGMDSINDMLGLDRRRSRNFYHWRPGTKYAYSNFDGGLLGSLIEACSDENITSYMQQHVFAPLGVEGAYAVSALSDPTRASDTFNENGAVRDNAAKLGQRPFDDSCAPQHHYDMTTGSLWISGPDLLRVGMMLCGRGQLDGVRILSSETVEAMEADQKGLGGITCTSPYGLSVNRVTNLIDGEMIYGHQGIAGGVLANLYYEPKQQLTFVLIVNGCDNTLLDRIARFSRNAFKACWEAFSLPPELLPSGEFVVVEDED